MNNIKKVSSYLIYVFNFLLVAIPALLIAQWVLIDWHPFKELIAKGMFFNLITSPQGYINLADVKFTFLTRILGFIGCVIDELPTILSIVIFKLLFQNYKKGNIFSLENAKKYNQIGWLCFVNGLITAPLAGMFMVAAATLSNPPGQRYISVSFGTVNLESLFYGILIIVISWVMVEGYKLQEDSQYTI